MLIRLLLLQSMTLFLTYSKHYFDYFHGQNKFEIFMINISYHTYLFFCGYSEPITGYEMTNLCCREIQKFFVSNQFTVREMREIYCQCKVCNNVSYFVLNKKFWVNRQLIDPMFQNYIMCEFFRNVSPKVLFCVYLCILQEFLTRVVVCERLNSKTIGRMQLCLQEVTTCVAHFD